MLKLFNGIIALFGSVARYFSNKQLIDAGKNDAAKKVLENVEKARDAKSRANSGIISRLRKRYGIK